MKLTTTSGWRSTISHRVREREIQRQIMYNNLGKYVRDRVPPLFREFLRMILGSLVAIWIIGELLLIVFHVSPFYTYAILGLFYSIQSTYYKYRLSVDPNYKIPKCRCNARQNENMEQVLKSTDSTILRIPNSVFAMLFYSVVLIMRYFGHLNTLVLVAVIAFCVSVYMSYVMIAKIGSLCANCINISALNMLILLQALFSLLG